MSDENKTATPEGSVTETSGSVEGQLVSEKPDSLDLSNYVPRTTYEKAIREKKNAMETLKVKERTDLENKEQYKELYDMKQKEAEDLQVKLDKQSQLITEAKKVGTLKSELQKLGMDQRFINESIKLVDLSKIIVDEETSTITGADLCAKLLSEKFPPLFQTKSPGVSHQAPVGMGKPLDLDTWKQLPYDEKIKREPELYQNLGITRRK